MADQGRGSPVRNTPAGLGRVARLLRKVGSVVEVRVEGTSMEPSLPADVMVRIRCTGMKAMEPGDVVAFLAGGRRLTIHRLVLSKTRRPYVLTRGDANIFCDPPVPVGDVVGRVMARSSGDDAWGPVPDIGPRTGFFGAVATFNARLTAAALTLHVRLAQGVALASLALILPRAIALSGRAPSWPPVMRMLSLDRPSDYP